MSASIERAWVATLALILLVGLAACGGGHTAPGTGGLAGKYVMDVDRTIASGFPDADEATAAALREQFRPDSYQVDLRTDGTFAFEAALGQDSIRVSGTWGQGPDGSWVRTETVNGEAPDPEEPVLGEFEAEEDRLVLKEAGQRIYLRKAP